jgi:hypothetical protein
MQPTTTFTDADSAQIIAHIEQRIDSAGGNPTLMNALPAYAKHYHVNVLSLGALTPAQWLADYHDSLALAAWNAVQHESQSHAADNALVAQLERLAAQLDTALAKLRDLETGQPDDESDTPDSPENSASDSSVRARHVVPQHAEPAPDMSVRAVREPPLRDHPTNAARISPPLRLRGGGRGEG